MQKNISFLAAGILALGVGGCDPVDQVVKPSVERHLAESNMQSAKTALRTQQEIDDLKKGIEALKAKISSMELYQQLVTGQIGDLSKPQAAYVQDGGAYGVAKTLQGSVLISIDKTEPYLDGYKLTLSVGNLTAATMNGADFDVSWGLPYDFKKFTMEQINASRKQKKISTALNFVSGAYTLVDVIL